MGIETLKDPVAQHEQLDFGLSPEQLEQLPLEARIIAQLIHNEDLHAYVKDVSEATAEIVRSIGSDQEHTTKAMRRLLQETDQQAKRAEVEYDNKHGRRMVPTPVGIDFLHKEIGKLP